MSFYIAGAFRTIDGKINNYFYKFRQLISSSQISDIAIIEVDKKDLTQGKLWPWQEKWPSYLINLLASYNPQLIVLLVPDFNYSIYDNELLSNINLSKVVVIHNDDYENLISQSGNFYNVSAISNNDIQTSALVRLIYTYYGFNQMVDKFYIDSNHIIVERPNQPSLEVPLNKTNLVVNLSDSEIPHYNYFDILVKAQKLSTPGSLNLDEVFRGKIVIFSDNEKIYSTALGEMSKAEILANAIYTLSERNFVKKGYVFSIPFIFFSGILLFILLTKFNVTGRTFTWVISTISMLIICYYLFSLFGILITVSTPLILVTLLYVDVNFYRILQHKNIKLEQKKQELAYDIKKKAVPFNIPKLEGMDLQVGMIRSRGIGGDFYNFIKINDDRLVIFVGTVSGTGLEGAQQIENIITKLQLMYNENAKLGSLCRQLNQDLSIEAEQGRFVKFLVADVDFSDGLVRLINAGEIPPFVIYPRSSHIRRIKSEDPCALGVYKNRFFQEQVFRLHAGDIFMILSEGMYEASQIVVGGIDFEKIFSNHSRRISHFVSKIIAESKKVYNGSLHSRDRTLIMMKKL